ncbi:hypothetical protein [Mucilaginibacter sp. UYCu711]|uniref:hypothetical protein n=1 Tax=Mucilaginibacter sp. UYCu711 TaxID=3156339 RepID=UPI003D211A10
MSFTILGLGRWGENIYAIKDKSSGAGSSLNGEIVNWKFKDDNSLKSHKIADNIYCTGGGICDMSDRLLNHIKQSGAQLPSEIMRQPNNQIA